MRALRITSPPGGRATRRASVAVLAATLVYVAVVAGRAGGSTAGLSLLASDPGRIAVGDDVTFTLTAENAGPGAASAVEIRDLLVDGVVLSAATTDRGACDPGATVVCRIGTLGPGERATVIVRVAATRAGSHEMTGRVTSPDDAASSNDHAPHALVAAGPTCTIIGTPGPDILVPTSAADVTCGLGGDDEIEVDTDDHALGGDGNDRITAIAGAATLDGGAGNDLIFGGTGDDVLRGGDGDDELFGGDGHDHLDDRAGENILDGGDGDDACTRVGRSCFIPAIDDRADAPGLFDIRSVRPTFGTVSRFSIGTWERWSPRDVWEHGSILISFDTRGGPEAEYIASVRVQRGVLRAALIDVAARPDDPLFRLTVTRPSAHRLILTVPITRMRHDADRLTYRWGVTTTWIRSACPGAVCLDGAPAPDVLLPQPRP